MRNTPVHDPPGGLHRPPAGPIAARKAASELDTRSPAALW